MTKDEVLQHLTRMCRANAIRVTPTFTVQEMIVRLEYPSSDNGKFDMLNGKISDD